MISTRNVWKVYKTFSSQEQQKFITWLQTEITPARKEFQLAIFFQEALEKGIVPEETLIKKSVGENGEACKEEIFRKLCSRLNSFINTFLAIEELRKDTLSLKGYTLRALNKRKVPELFKHEYKKAQSFTKNLPKDAQWFRFIYQLEKEHFKYQIQHERKLKKYQLAKINEMLDYWWIHEKMGDACTSANYESIFGDVHTIPFLDEGLAYIRKSSSYAGMHILHLFEHIYNLLTNNNPLSLDEIFDQFKIEISNKKIPHNIQIGIHGLLLNHSIKVLNQSGAPEDAEKVYKLYEWGIEYKLAFQNGYLPVESYKNLINICLKMNDISKAKHYLETYQTYLSPSIGTDAYKFNYASILFASKKFEEVVKTYYDYQFVNVFYEIQGKAMNIQAQYELQNREPDDLLQQIEALRRFIYNQKLGDTYKNLYKNRVKYLKKLVLAYSPEKLKKLQLEIEKEIHLNYKKWFLEKIEERLDEI